MQYVQGSCNLAFAYLYVCSQRLGKNHEKNLSFKNVIGTLRFMNSPLKMTPEVKLKGPFEKKIPIPGSVKHL